MATVTYTARRSLMAGHAAGEEYTFDLALSDWTPRRRREVASATSLSGRQFNRFTRLDKEWRVAAVADDNEVVLAQREEFLDSVAGGETFVIEHYGQVYTGTIEGDPNWSLTNSVGFYSISFTMREFV